MNGGDALGVLGGSGLYDLEGLEDLREHPVTTPWGAPSAPPMVGRLGGQRVIFIPRHGHGHRYLPSEVNYRANVCAFKQLGATRVLAISAVGSMREEIHPGDLVLVDQFIDRTYQRDSTFFGAGCAGHVAFAEPVCAELGRTVAAAAGDATLSGKLHLGGIYLCMEGPQFSTRAESLLHRSWGISVVGMTAAPEAKLCREAELCFSLLALATDYDCWHSEEAAVTVEAVMAVIKANVAAAKDVVRRTVGRLAAPRTCACGTAARHAIMTGGNAISPEARERLRVLYGREIP